MKPISAETRAAIIADIKNGELPPAVALRYGVSDDSARNFYNEAMAASGLGEWPDIPANAFEDDPRACRQLPGRPILGLRWAS